MASSRAFCLAIAAASSLVAADPLYIHVVPHSHCDPGWLSKFENYYAGEVESILSAVTQELTLDPSRRFVWAEISFFMRWLETQTEGVKQTVRRLVQTGQLEFVGAGWVQEDNANPSYDAIIAQLTEGHDYVATLFGVKPRIAYSIDPFGASAATAAIAAVAGYDALVINRVDYSVKEALKARAALEFVWHPYALHPALAAAPNASSRSSADGGFASYSSASIFTHVLHTHYSAPKGYDFENGEGQPILESNVKERSQSLISELRRRAQGYRTSHLLVVHGDDFKFRGGGAHSQFSNLDKLISYIRSHSGEGNGTLTGAQIAYSTLSEYFDAVHAESSTGVDHTSLFDAQQGTGDAKEDTRGSGRTPAIAVGGALIPFPEYSPASGFSDGGVDFFPYADNANSWWTGYYTSRPSLKRAIRSTMSSLRAAEALLALVRPWASTWQTVAQALSLELQQGTKGHDDAPSSDGDVSSRLLLDVSPYASYSWQALFQRLEQTRLDLALCLHHDAITGTSRADVVEDYTARMKSGAAAAIAALSDMASLLLGGLPRAVAHSRAHNDAGSTRRRRSDDAGTADTAAAGAGGRQFPRRIHQRGGGGGGAPTEQQQGDTAIATARSRLLDFSEVISLGPAGLTFVPHVIPVAEYLRLHVETALPSRINTAATDATGADAGAEAIILGSLRVKPDTHAHPVVVHNPTGWKRRAVVTVTVDIGSHAAAAAAATTTKTESALFGDASNGGPSAGGRPPLACRLQQWPYAVVSDDAGRPVPSQWLATHESAAALSSSRSEASYTRVVEALEALPPSDARWTRIRSAFAAHGLGSAGAVDADGLTVLPFLPFESLFLPERPSFSLDGGERNATAEAEALAALSKAALAAAQTAAHASDTRYELAFVVEVPPLGLSTFFVSVGWDVLHSQPATEGQRVGILDGTASLRSGIITHHVLSRIADDAAVAAAEDDDVSERGRALSSLWASRARHAEGAACDEFEKYSDVATYYGTSAAMTVGRGCSGATGPPSLPFELAAIGATGATTALFAKPHAPLSELYARLLAAATAAAQTAVPAVVVPAEGDAESKQHSETRASAIRAFISDIVGPLGLASEPPDPPADPTDARDISCSTPAGLPRLALASSEASASDDRHAAPSDGGRDEWAMENACMRVEVAGRTGLISAIVYKHAAATTADDAGGFAPVRVSVSQSFGYYSTTSSGAYMFRPVDAPVDLTSVTGMGDDDSSSSSGKSASVSVTMSPLIVPHRRLNTELGERMRHATTGLGLGPDAEGAARRRSNGVIAPLLLQQVRVVGPTYAQSIRLTDAMGWSAGETSSLSHALLATMCADPLNPDGSIEVRPTVSAESNQEIVMMFDTDVDVLPATSTSEDAVQPPACGWSSNIRDNIHGQIILDATRVTNSTTIPSAAQPAGPDSGRSCGPVLDVPTGWWTSDGLGLLRRPPAPPGTPDRDITRHYYPLNALTRIAGRIRRAAPQVEVGSAAATLVEVGAWVSLYSAQPFGTTTRAHSQSLPNATATNGRVGRGSGGSRIEVMLHRHLKNDDGRGLGTGVTDTTVLTARFSLTVGGVVAPAAAATAAAAATGPGEVQEHQQRCAQTCSSLGRGSSSSTRAASDGAPDAPPLESTHDEWLWAWSTRSAIHHAPLTLLHADLVNELAVAAETTSIGVDDTSANLVLISPPAFVPPPKDASAPLAHLSFVAAEPGVPISAWVGKYSTRYEPLGSTAATSAAAPAAGADAAGAADPATALWRVNSAAPAPQDDDDALAPSFSSLYPYYLHQSCSQALERAPHALLQDHAGLCSGSVGSSSRGGSGGSKGGFGGIMSGLPPWVHVLSLHVRDAVSDDSVLRLQNNGGPSVTVNMRVMLKGSHGARAHVDASPLSSVHLPLSVSSLRPRTLSLNHHEAYVAGQEGHHHHHSSSSRGGTAPVHVDDVTHRHHLVFKGQRGLGSGTVSTPLTSATSTAAVAAAAAAAAAHPAAALDLLSCLRSPTADVVRDTAAYIDAMGKFVASSTGSSFSVTKRSARGGGGGAAAGDDGSRQNTEEEGVFVSDAAMEKIRRDAEEANVLEQQQQQQQAPGQQLPMRHLLLVNDADSAVAAPQQQQSWQYLLDLPPTVIRSLFIGLAADDVELVSTARSIIAALSPPPTAPPPTADRVLTDGGSGIPSDPWAAMPGESVAIPNGKLGKWLRKVLPRDAAAAVLVGSEKGRHPPAPVPLDRPRDAVEVVPVRKGPVATTSDGDAAGVNKGDGDGNGAMTEKQQQQHQPSYSAGDDAAAAGDESGDPSEIEGLVEVSELSEGARLSIVVIALAVVVCCGALCCTYVLFAPNVQPPGPKGGGAGWIAATASNPRAVYKSLVHSSKVV